MKSFETGRTLVLGTGYVASAYLRALHFLGLCPMALSRKWLDYTDADQLSWFMRSHKPQLVINAAGYTGRTVDDCEVNKQECYAANVALPRTVAEVCKELDVSLIHVSSGCIFMGSGPFDEQSQPNNLGQFYAQCKIHAEKELAQIGVRAWIFRIRMPFNWQNNPRNWLTKLTSYPRILDGLNSVTFLDEFAMRSYHLAQKAPPGVYHAASSVPIRTAFVARMLFDAGIRHDPVIPFPYAEFIAAGHVQRSEAVLDVRKFEAAYGSDFGDPIVAVRWCIEQLRNPTASASAPADLFPAP